MERTLDAIRRHYEIEIELATRLRSSTWEDRVKLYGQVYDELFQRVPDHPQLNRKSDQNARAAAITERMYLLSRFLCSASVFLEIGAGDCALSKHVASLVDRCIALDVSSEILEKADLSRMEVVLSDGRSVPVVDGSITVAYSYQVMEHIHPDDALEQLRNIYRALAIEGTYICVTPNRLNGPHDVSRYFDQVARGFHLKEYTVSDLSKLFKDVGFRRIEAFVGLRHYYFRVPLGLLKVLEALLESLPYGIRHWIANVRGFQNLLFISLAATK